ncbi:MAG: hypothetical protein LBD07_00395 [Spirochaetaceae bacterium]|jgi:hypothetical protein|nr:hypothetical protein [Spirochaetaceae bacterium]
MINPVILSTSAQFKANFTEKTCALAVGTIEGVIRFFFMNFWKADGFGLSRYISACLDYVMLPIIAPLVVCFLFVKIMRLLFKQSQTPDWTGFVLISMIPLILVCSIRWGTEKNPLNLVLIPLLWSAEAFNLHFPRAFAKQKSAVSHTLLSIAGIAANGFLGAAIWWAFFASKTIMAFILLFIELCPAVLTVLFLVRTCKSHTSHTCENLLKKPSEYSSKRSH